MSAFPALRVRADLPAGWVLTTQGYHDRGGELWQFALAFLTRLALAADAARTVAPELTMRGDVGPGLRGCACRLEWQIRPGTVRLTGPGGVALQLSRA